MTELQPQTTEHKLYHLILNHIKDITQFYSCCDILKQHKQVADVLLAYNEQKENNNHIHMLVKYKRALYTTLRDNVKKAFTTLGNTTYEHIEIKEYRQIEYIIEEKKNEPKSCLINKLTEDDITEFKNKYINKENKKEDEYETYLKSIKDNRIEPTNYIDVLKFTLDYLLEIQLQENKNTPYYIVKGKAILYSRKYSSVFDEIYREQKKHELIKECCG